MFEIIEIIPKVKNVSPGETWEEDGFFITEIRLKNENVSPGETLVKGMFINPT